MTKKFTAIWGDQAGPRTIARRPAAGAASAAADAESGTGAPGARQALFALKAMFDRGLIDRDAYEARKAEIEAGRIEPED